MGRIKIIFVLAIIILSFGTQTINAQSRKKKNKEHTESIEDIRRKKALLNEKQGLKAMEREDEVAEDPCSIYDDDEWYTAFNQKEGRKGDPQLASSLLRLCIQQLKTKIGGRYQAVVHDYFDQMDVDGQSSAASHIESAGEQIIDKMLGDVRENLRKTSDVQDNGNIIMYMNIKVRKEEIVDKLVQGISKEKQNGIRLNEAKFRESAFKAFDCSPSEKNQEKEE